MQDKPLINSELYDKITESIGGIEENVSKLNECSTGDFIMLNRYLKKQYARIKNISDNVTNVFELTAGKENVILSGKIQTFQAEFKDSLRCSENFFTKNSEIIDRVISYVNLMYIPQKNYAQNIFTLTFLSSSLKFNLLLNKDKREDFSDEIELFREHTQEVKKINAVFEETVGEIKNLHDKIQERIRELKEANHINTERAEEKISTALKNLSDKKYQGERRIPELQKIKQRYQENISEIITNLQYSDIIRQKIEHISEAHKNMIDKINSIKEKDDSELTEQYMLQIKDIADLQIAQLIRTNHEYQSAVQVIAEKFVDVRSDINELTGDTLKISGLRTVEPGKHHDFYLVEEQLDRVREITDKYVLQNNDIDNYIKQVVEQMQKFAENFDVFEELTLKIHNLAQSVIEKSKSMFGDNDNIMDIVKQFETVRKSADKNRNDIVRYYQKCTTDRDKLAQSKEEDTGCRREVKTYADDIKSLLENIKQKNINIRNIIVETENLEKTVAKDINSAVKEIQYYTFYEQAASNIIDRLKELFDLIQVEHKSKSEKNENLKEHRASYTMKSERIIHDQVAQGTERDDEDDEDDIEFF